MHYTKSISIDLETAKKLDVWMRKNEVKNLSFAVCHLIMIALSTRNNGVGVRQAKLTTDVSSVFEEVLEEQGFKKPKIQE